MKWNCKDTISRIACFHITRFMVVWVSWSVVWPFCVRCLCAPQTNNRNIFPINLHNRIQISGDSNSKLFGEMNNLTRCDFGQRFMIQIVSNTYCLLELSKCDGISRETIDTLKLMFPINFSIESFWIAI